MSRLRAFALIAVLVVSTAVFAACGGGDDDGGSGDGGGNPQQLVDNAGLEGVKSGDLDLSIHVQVEGEDAGEFEIHLSGPFEQGARGELPQLEMTAEASESDGDEFKGGLTLLTDRAFVDVEGTPYEVDPTTFGFVKAALEQSQQQGGKEDITACQKAAEGITFSQFGDNLETEGGVDVDGTETTKVSGDFNVSGFLDAMFKLIESPACASQLEAAGSLPEEGELEQSRREVVEAVKESHVELYVGEDEIIRKALVEMTVVPEKGEGDRAEMDVEATLSGVNEEQSFSAPEGAKPLEDLYKKLGINPIELLEAASGEGGLEALLEGITGGAAGGGPSSGGDSAEGKSDAYVQCLQKAANAAQMQKCASLLE